MSTLDWWRTGTIYQVYIRSFADSNGDGTGDINGLRSKLPYLADLGIDGIWINPWYPSPLLDGGYDVADYRDIHPSYGTLEDADAMIKEAHELGIRILVDLVPNHCSWDHVWFKAALQAAPGSPERARFHFTEGSVADDGTVGPPNNWKSVFGGSAWTQVDDGQWYLHLFDPSQPDLDWTHPEVREEFRSILRFWLDRGADGFRVDVAHGLAKDMDFPDLSDHVQILSSAKQPNHAHWDRDELHEIVREWRAVLDEYDDRMMVAEAWVSEESLPKYLRPDEYHQSFSFDLLMAAWNADAYRSTIASVYEPAKALGAASTWVLSNHDVIRHVTRLSYKEIPKQGDGIGPDYPQPDEAKGQRIGRAASAFMLGLPGSSYLYQGEELGLPEHTTLESEYRQDPTFFRTKGERVGRDGCRVPIPWEADAPAFGFSETGKSWLPQPENYRGYSRDRQQGVAGSTLELYKRLLSLRKSNALGDGNLEWVESLCTDSTLAYKNNSVLVVANFGPDSLALPEGELLVTTQHDLSNEGVLEHDQVAWIKL